MTSYMEDKHEKSQQASVSPRKVALAHMDTHSGQLINIKIVACNCIDTCWGF